MIVLAMIAFGWLAMMTLVVSSCRAARLGDQAQREIPVAQQPPPQPVSQPIRRRRRAGMPDAARRIREPQRPF
jgi:hypothetical protein